MATTKKRSAKKSTKSVVRKSSKAKKKSTASKKKVSKSTKRSAAKKTTAKTTAKKRKASSSKATKKTKSKRKPNPAFMRPFTPSSALAKVVGVKPLPRTKVVQKLWAYIKKNELQDSANRRNINADDTLKPIFGKNTVSMFEMSKLVNKHLS